jgi:N utilization substance protein A
MPFESMPRQDLLLAIESLADEKMIDKEIVFESLEIAIAKIAKHKYGEEFNIVVTIDRKNGAIVVKRLFEVIESPESKGDDYNPNTMLTVKQAQKYKADANVGDVVEDILPEPEFGRMAFQTARQIMTMRVRDAEKGRQYEEFKDSIGDIVWCVVKHVEHGGNVYVEVNGKAEGYIKHSDMIGYEKPEPNNRFRALILDVVRSNTGPQIMLTRTHKLFMEKLFAQEVPEIYEGVIQIKSVAREPGSHAKIAVETSDPKIDAVGMTVGIKGTRIQPVINECCGEKIDVVLYSEDPTVFINNAMKPVEVEKIILDEYTKKAKVVIKAEDKKDGEEENTPDGKKDKNVGKAIGRDGQNVKLASQLTGWEITVISKEADEAEHAREEKETTELFMKALGKDEKFAKLLFKEAFRSLEEIAYVPQEELTSIKDITPEIAEDLQNRARNYLQIQEQEYFEKGRANGMSDDLLNFDAISQSSIVELGEKGVKTLFDLSDLEPKDLVEKLGNNMSENLAKRVIETARDDVYNTVLSNLAGKGIKTVEDVADMDSLELIEVYGNQLSESVAGRIIMKAREIAYGITEDK